MRKPDLVILLLSACVVPSGIAWGKEKPRSTPIDVAGAPSECDAVAGNLVANCGFESGDLTAWTHSGDQTFTDVLSDPGYAHSGNWALVTGPIDRLGFIAQNLATTPGQTYTLTFWLRSGDRPNQFQVSWDSMVIQELIDSPGFPYTPLTFTGLAASTDSTEIKFGFYNVPDFFYLDDVTVTPES